MGKLFKLLNYVWIIDVVLSIFKTSKSLFDSKEPIRNLAESIREMLGGKELTAEDVLKIIDIIKASKDLGSLDMIHEALTTKDSKDALINLDQVLKFGSIGLNK